MICVTFSLHNAKTYQKLKAKDQKRKQQNRPTKRLNKMNLLTVNGICSF